MSIEAPPPRFARWDGAYSWDTPPSATGAPPRLTVATCQMPVGLDCAANAGAIVALVREAASAGADVAHFPECAISGYGPVPWPDWSGFDWDAIDAAVGQVCQAARACGIWVVAGSVHRASIGARPTNALLVIDRAGEAVGRYDKRRCSANDLRAFRPGECALSLDIDGVRCGFLICLDWAFPELWAEYAGRVELVFHSCVADAAGRDRVAAHVIPSLMQGYAWLGQYAVSVSNSCRPTQDFASFWIERSGHAGAQAAADRAGLIVSALAENAEQDRFFAMVRRFRNAASNGTLYAPHLAGSD